MGIPPFDILGAAFFTELDGCEGLPLQAIDIVSLLDAIGYDVVLKKR